MNTPNKLSLLRIVGAFFFFVCMRSSALWSSFLALFLYTFCAFTDFIDGYLAKKRKQITVFGRFIDPVADKILLLFALIAFLERHYISPWCVVLILMREFCVMALRFIALSQTGRVLSASPYGKIKTICQFVTLFIIAVFHHQQISGMVIVSNKIFFLLIQIFMGITLFVTLFSGAEYLWTQRDCFRENT